MVVLTIVMQKNGETVYFDEPFPKVDYMKLLSCSLYNSWHNLTKVGQLSFKKTGNVLTSIPEGHYNVETLAKELTKSSKNEKSEKIILFEADNPNSVLKIRALFKIGENSEIQVSHALARFISSGTTLSQTSCIKKLNTPSTYFIRCNLIDRHQNFLNNKKTDVLAKFDVRGNPYEKVTYEASPQQPFRDCSTDGHVKSITISVRDEDGNLFDFNGLPLEFELEIN